MPTPSAPRKSPLGCLEPRLKHDLTTHGWTTPTRGTRQQRGYGAAWDRLRVPILKRDSYLCQPCLRAGRIRAANIVDHIVPKAQGGSDDPTNLEAICANCHRLKTQVEANRSRAG